MRKNTSNQFKLLPVVAAIMLVYGPAYAEDNSEVYDLITPSSSVTVGIGSVNNARDAKRFSQYTGLNKNASVLLDMDYNRRDAATGFWTQFSARNLGLETRQFNFSQSKQGDWKYALDYNEIVRLDPYIIHTGMTGIGSINPTVNLIAFPTMTGGGVPTVAGTVTATNPNGYKIPVAPALANDVELKLKRTAVGVSGEKWITPELQFEMSFRNEDKKGARLFGRAGLDSSDMKFRPKNVGTSAYGGWAVLLVPEPISSNTKLLEGKLNFNRDNLAVTAGYFGSFFTNNNTSLTDTVPGTLNRGALWTGCVTPGCSTVQALAGSSVALPPDNQAHQFYLTGNYAHSDTTRSNFKLAYTHATQNQSFLSQGLTPSAFAPANLGGVVDTTLVQYGLSMRPLKELSVNANFRYEDRADKTPLFVYNTNGIAGNALNNTTNWNSGSQTRTTAKLDGVYRFASGYSLAMGGDWERKASPLPPSNTALFAAQVLFRPVLTETGIHADVRKNMSETLNGALGFEFKQRRGSDNGWVTTNGISTANPATSNVLVAFDPAGLLGNRVLPVMYMDRDRTKLRGNLDWEASEKLSLQAVAEHTQDNYLRAFSPVLLAAQQIPTIPGARTMISDSLSLDAGYRVSEDWRVNGFWTYSYNRWNVNKASLGDDTRNTDHTIGVGVNGNLTSRLSFGADVLTTRDTTTFNNVVATAIGGNIAGLAGQPLPGNFLPNINYSTKKLNLHAKYEVDKVSDVHMSFVYQQFKTDDWQWGYNGTPFLYSDNTTVSQPMSQALKYLSVSYALKF